jgi:hypothetical protein
MFLVSLKGVSVSQSIPLVRAKLAPLPIASPRSRLSWRDAWASSLTVDQSTLFIIFVVAYCLIQSKGS